MKHTRRSAGYTLIELLLYIAISSILLSSITVFAGLVVEARVKNQSIAEVDQQGARAMEIITQTIRNATSITAPAAGASANQLTLVVPTGALSPTVFNLSGSTLQITEGAGAAVALTTNEVQISNLTFKNVTRSGTPGIVQISFTVDRTNTSGRNEYTYQKVFTTSAEVTW